MKKTMFTMFVAVTVIAGSSLINAADPITSCSRIHLVDYRGKELGGPQTISYAVKGEKHCIPNPTDPILGGEICTIPDSSQQSQIGVGFANSSNDWSMCRLDGQNTVIKSGEVVVLKASLNGKDAYLNSQQAPNRYIGAGPKVGSWEQWRITKKDGNPGDIINSGDQILLQSVEFGGWLHSEVGGAAGNVNATGTDQGGDNYRGAGRDKGNVWTIKK